MNRDLDYLLRLISAAPPELAAAGDGLAGWLYSNGYVVRYPTAVPALSGDQAGIWPALAAANRGRSGWDAGWRVEFLGDDGSVIAVKGPVRRHFEPGGFVIHGIPGVRPRYGDALSAFAPVEVRSRAEGFYFAFSETIDPFETPGEQVRLYWNVSAEGAAPLVSAVTAGFNRFQLPFQFKCVYLPGEFYRLDAAVLYIYRHHWELSAKLLRRIHDEIADFLAPETPMLTKPLAPGLALAENPPGGRSFGQHRCELIGRAMPGDTSGLHRAFHEAGLDFEYPYLNSGSTDCYDLP